MSKITRLSAQKRSPNRVNIEVDGVFVTGLSLEEVVKKGLKKDQEVTPELLVSLQNQDERDKVLGKAINYLSYRPRTIKELEQRLTTYTKDPKIISYVTNYLTTNKYLDDLAFAKWWVKSRIENHSIRVISYELRNKGVAEDIIKRTLPTPSNDADSLKTLLTKKLKGNKSKLETDRPKLMRYFAAKGYDYSLIKQIFYESELEC